MADRQLLNSLFAKYTSSQAPDTFKQISVTLQHNQQSESRRVNSLGKASLGRDSLNADEELDQCYDILWSQPSSFMKQKTASSKKVEPQEFQQSARKIFTPSKPPRKKQPKKQKHQFYDPYDSLKHLAADTEHILSQIKAALQNEQCMSEQLLKLGMKNSKALGNVKSRRQLANISLYLEKGQLPPQYMQKLQALISD